MFPGSAWYCTKSYHYPQASKQFLFCHVLVAFVHPLCSLVRNLLQASAMKILYLLIPFFLLFLQGAAGERGRWGEV